MLLRVLPQLEERPVIARLTRAIKHEYRLQRVLARERAIRRQSVLDLRP